MSTDHSLRFIVKSPGVVIASNGIGHEQQWCMISRNVKTDHGYIIIAMTESKFSSLSGVPYPNYKSAKQAVLDHWCSINKIQTLVEVSL